MSTPIPSPARGKILVPRLRNSAEIMDARKLYFRYEVHSFSSDQYLSSYVVAEILMEIWNRCTNEYMQYYERMRGGENLGRGELKKKEKRNEKEWKKKREKYSHTSIYVDHTLIKFIFPYRFYVVPGSITWWWVWNMYGLISGRDSISTDVCYYGRQT